MNCVKNNSSASLLSAVYMKPNELNYIYIIDERRRG